MISCSSSSSCSCHTDNESTYGMIFRVSNNRSICNGYLANKMISKRYRNNCNPENSESTENAGKTKTVYAEKNRYHISIVQLAEFSDIAWGKKKGFDLRNSSVVSLSGGNSVSYLITLVDNKVPMDT